MLSFTPMFSPNECQLKSFEKMNTLLSATFKFCTIKNLFKKFFQNIFKALPRTRISLNAKAHQLGWLKIKSKPVGYDLFFDNNEE